MNQIKQYRALRRANDITLKQVADYCNVHFTYISKMELGQCAINPTIFEMYKRYIDSKINEGVG